MDIDGAYIKDENYMVEDSQVKKGFKYYPSEIHAYSKDKIITRNNKKSGVMNVLSSTNQISAIDYRAYYFWCNLDHILYNEANLESSLKIDYAYDFQDEYFDNETEFINFMLNNDFTVKGEHKET